jgi:transportin-3
LTLLTIFISNITPYYEPGETNQAVTYCQELLPVLSAICSAFVDSLPILECVCRCWRAMITSYRTGSLPMLEELATQLAKGFELSRQGCFLWATGAVLREFSADVEFVDPTTSQAVYNFFEQQAFAFLKIMDQLPPKELPDGM